MTAQVTELFPTGEQADETVRRTVMALIKGRGLAVEDVADAIHMNRTTLYRRLNGRGSKQAFKAGEVAALARYFGVSVAQIFDGLGGTFVASGDDGPNGGRGVRHTGVEPVTRWLSVLRRRRAADHCLIGRPVGNSIRSADSDAA